jgi:N4-gp56 family major capsid protein
MTWREAKEHSCFYYLTGKDAGSPIYEQPELKKDRGDRIHISLTENIDIQTGVSGHGYGAENTLAGNEYQLVDRSDNVAIDQLRQALRTSGKLTEQRASYDVRAEMKDKLMHWGPRVHDMILFNKLAGQTFQDAGSNTVFSAGVTNTNVLYPGTATANDELTAADVFDLDLILDAKTCAKVGYIGSTKIYKMRPSILDGEPHYLCLVHPYHVNAIKHSQTWKDAIMNARERAKTNPVWTGIVAVWDGVAFKEHDLVFTGSDAGSGANVAYATALFLGGQAAAYAPAQDGYDWVEETFDYGQKWGIATGFVAGFEKVQFNSLDFSTIAIITAAANPRV